MVVKYEEAAVGVEEVAAVMLEEEAVVAAAVTALRICPDFSR